MVFTSNFSLNYVIQNKIKYDYKLGKLIFMIVIVIEGGASMQMSSKNLSKKNSIKSKSDFFGVKK
jgi:hypothetical protein